jgi:hypothetical protein
MHGRQYRTKCAGGLTWSGRGWGHSWILEEGGVPMQEGILH